MTLFAPCPPGAERILADELAALGAGSVEMHAGGVRFESDIELSYRACLYLRTASRLLLQVAAGAAEDENRLYELALNHPWESLFSAERSIVCRVTGVPRERDPRFATLRLKDGVADRFTAATGRRPSVNKLAPDVRIEARWDGERAVVYLSWSGPPLHERSYRVGRTQAVLRETTAAAVLAMADWPSIAAGDGAFVDPVCGSGTLLAEAAMWAVDAPPGIHRKSWGFEALTPHRAELWDSVRNMAAIDFGVKIERLPMMVGFDRDEGALSTARANLRRAGLQRSIRLERHDLLTEPPKFWPRNESGLICADPPWGLRSGGDPLPVYSALGGLFRSLGPRWHMALLAPDRKTAAASFLRADRYLSTVSGGQEIILALYSRIGGKSAESGIRPKQTAAGREMRGLPDRQDTAAASPENSPFRTEPDSEPDPKAPALKAALKRNLDAMEAWAGRKGVTSYRIWDSDMPEFNAAVDWYENRWLHVQEFAAPSRIPPATVRRRFETLLDALQAVTGCPDDRIFLKTRRRGVRPYGRFAGRGERFIVREYGLRFWVNFVDYLDTGLFLDHRPTRALIRQRIGGGRFLNLFSYTGTATVAAAAGGASATVSVDVSNTYLEWNRSNLELNGMDTPAHRRVRSDASEYLRGETGLFDLIFVDPPTYSNGTGRGDWSVQENHAGLIRLAMDHLTPAGELIFSENFRQFRMDDGLGKSFDVRDITRDTTDPDFVRRGGAHRCWIFSHRRDS